MVWNIEFQIAGLILTVVCASVIFAQKRIEFWAERSFTHLLLGVILCTVCDILSIFAINTKDTMNPVLVEFFCELYLFTIVLVGFFASLYAVAEINFRFRLVWRLIACLPMVFQVLVSIIFKTEIYVNEADASLYTYGVPVIITYVSAMNYIVATIVMTIVLKKYVSAHKRRVILLSMGTWIMAGVIQGLNNQLLVVTYAMAIVCIYIYCKLENPENHLDVNLDVFNKYGFTALIKEFKRLDKNKAVIAISFFNTNSISEIFGSATFEELKKTICNYLKSIKNVSVFRVDDGMYTLILENESMLDEIVDTLRFRLAKHWEIDDTQIVMESGIVYTDNISRFTDTEEIMETFHYFLNEANRRKETVICIDEDELQKRKHSLDIQNALEWALANDGVTMFYQPIYSIEAGCFASMEALVRIRDEYGKLIMPGEFVEFAEQNGMILKLGETVFRKVCEFIQRNHIGRYGIEYIEVNLSVVQCMQDDLADKFMNIMGEYQIPPHMINLEITETAAINTHEVLENNMNRLRKYGSTFSLDDYGSGYSNLTYIVGMPLKIIKIDRSLTIAYGKNEKARVVVEYTIDMVHRLGMEIVVEGIETEEQYSNFKKLGVEYIQGYYFSKPLPQDSVLNYVQEWM